MYQLIGTRFFSPMKMIFVFIWDEILLNWLSPNTVLSLGYFMQVFVSAYLLSSGSRNSFVIIVDGNQDLGLMILGVMFLLGAISSINRLPAWVYALSASGLVIWSVILTFAASSFLALLSPASLYLFLFLAIASGIRQRYYNDNIKQKLIAVGQTVKQSSNGIKISLDALVIIAKGKDAMSVYLESEMGFTVPIPETELAEKVALYALNKWQKVNPDDSSDKRQPMGSGDNPVT